LSSSSVPHRRFFYSCHGRKARTGLNYISGRAKLGKDVSAGQLSVIEDDVVIGDNCTIGHHVVIHRGSVIGNNVRIDDHAVIGKQPMRAATSIFKEKGEKEQPLCRIGDDCIIGTSAIIYAGAEIQNGCLIADLATVREGVIVGSLRS